VVVGAAVVVVGVDGVVAVVVLLVLELVLVVVVVVGVIAVVDGVVGDGKFDTPCGRSDRIAAYEHAVLFRKLDAN
jgi:hypothetical protein